MRPEDRLRVFSSFSPFLILGVLVWPAGILMPLPAAAQSQFEAPVTFRTVDVLPGVRLRGSNYTIAPSVQNDGFMNQYQLTVKGQTYTIDGTDQLMVRLRELSALQTMEALKGTSVFTSAAKKAVMAPIEGAKALVTRPVDTIVGMGRGVRSFFSSLGHATFGSPSEQEEGVLKTAVGFGSARRQFAARFGIDPYTSFPPVKNELANIAWSATGGNLTVGVAFQALPSGAKGAIVGTKATHGFNRIIYDTPPAELKKINRRMLDAMGVTPAVAELFLDHPKFSPTHKTEIVLSLEQIAAYDREVFIQRAILADNESAAFFVMGWARMFQAYHNKVAPLARFLRLGRMPIAQRKDGVLIAAVPVDHLLWTSAIATQHGQNMQNVRKISGVTAGEIWLVGTISPTARRNLEAQNWVVHENKGRLLGMR